MYLKVIWKGKSYYFTHAGWIENNNTFQHLSSLKDSMFLPELSTSLLIIVIFALTAFLLHYGHAIHLFQGHLRQTAFLVRPYSEVKIYALSYSTDCQQHRRL